MNIQQAIIDKYGQERINEERERLCSTCKDGVYPRAGKEQYASCKTGLLPLTLDGQECPYYGKGGK